MDHLSSRGTPGFSNHVIDVKCKQCNDVSTLAQKCSPVFKKIALSSECVTHESYIKLILFALYRLTIRLIIFNQNINDCLKKVCIWVSKFQTTITDIPLCFKDRLQSLLRIGCAHNKCGPHCPNFAFLKTFELKDWFIFHTERSKPKMCQIFS